MVRTHKDRYDNASYYQSYPGATEKERVTKLYTQIYLQSILQLPTPLLYKVHEDDTIIELSWKLQGYEHETITYVLEGSSSFASSNNANYSDGTSSDWKVCYRGPDTTQRIRDIYLVAFRVQAFNKRSAASPWSDVCFAHRTPHRSTKRQTPSYGQTVRSQYHNQTYSNQQYQINNQQRQPSPPIQKSDALVQKITEAVESIPSTPIKVPACSVPKFANITQSSIEISWKLTTAADLSADISNKNSLIYELQRVDKQALIIYSGNNIQFRLEHLRPVEHVSVYF